MNKQSTIPSLVAAAVLLAAPEVGAQVPVVADDHVRITTSDPHLESLEGDVLAIGATQLTLESRGRPYRVPRSMITSLEVRTEYADGVSKGFLVGAAAAGGTIMVLSAIAIASDDGGDVPWGGLFIVTGLSAVVGGAVGGLIGATMSSETWEPGTLPPVELEVAPSGKPEIALRIPARF